MIHLIINVGCQINFTSLPLQANQTVIGLDVVSFALICLVTLGIAPGIVDFYFFTRVINSK